MTAMLFVSARTFTARGSKPAGVRTYTDGLPAISNTAGRGRYNASSKTGPVMASAALTPGREADPLIATFHGGMTDEAREEVKRAFNAELSQHQLRVLIATDAAREGVNLQNNCADLFHFDVPWNPSRLE